MRYVGLYDGGDLVASARELDLTLRQDGCAVRAMGIAAVFVPEALRGRGLGKRLVRALVDDAAARGCAAALLFSDIEPAYYERLGFCACRAEDWRAPIHDLLRGTDLSLRPADPADRPQQMSQFHAASPASMLTTERTITWWEYFRWWRNACEDYMLMRGDEVVGYLNASVTGDGLHVYEWAAPGVAPDAVWAAVRRLAEERGASWVDGWWTPVRNEPWMQRSPRPAAIPMLAPVPGAAPLLDPRKAAFEELDHF